MMRTAYFLLSLVLLNGNALRAQDYLLRVQPVSSGKPQATKAEGTIEFQVVGGRPFFVRSTLGDDSQFLLRGSLRTINKTTFEVEYFCQISELRGDPRPRLTRKGKVKLALGQQAELISKSSPTEMQSPLELIVSIKPLNPQFGARDDNSGWAVRLIDEAGQPVSGAHGGLYGPLTNGTNWEPIVEGRSNENGVIRFTEGREDLLWLTFYAEHKGRKLYTAAYLNADKIRSKNYKHFTVKMTESFRRWSKPAE